MKKDFVGFKWGLVSNDEVFITVYRVGDCFINIRCSILTNSYRRMASKQSDNVSFVETLQSKIRISNKSRVAGENKFRILHGIPPGEFSDSSKFFGEGFWTFLRAQQCSMSAVVQKQNWRTISWISCSWLWCKEQWKLPTLLKNGL